MVFTDYNTKFLDEAGVNHLIKELKEYMSGLATGDVDLSAYVTKEELQAKLDALDINIDLSSYATKEELEKAISGIDLSSYALKTDIPSLDGYATTEYVDNAIANIPTGDGSTDLTNYYTKEEVYNKEEVDNLIPSVDGLATTEYVDNAVSNIPATDLTGYATEEYVSTAINSIPSTDLSNYYNKEETYSKTEVDELVANSGSSDSGSSSSGGSSGITYAYETEIATGETWIDGKPIYMKVFHVDGLTTAPSSAITYSSYFTQDKFADEIVSIETTWKRESNNYYTSGNSVISPTAFGSTTSAATVVKNINDYIIGRELWVTVSNNTNFYIQVARGSATYYYGCNVFVKYTKL